MAGEQTADQATGETAPTSQVDQLAETLAPAPRSEGVDPAVGPPELQNHARYQIVRLLGRGGMGAVYQAIHKVMDRQVALKVMRSDLTENAAAVERFRREVKAAAQLVHPNIVTAYDAEQVGNLHFLVMEYVEGRNLADVIAAKGPLPVATAIEYTCQAARGLQHAFEKGMIHRDIKPHNLMIAQRGNDPASALVKILDFGLARFASEEGGGVQTASGLILGTVDFMAPEQADNARTADIRSDIYSLGCTLYYLLAGRAPFPEGTVIQRVMAHVERQPPPLRAIRTDLPNGFEPALSRMLAKKPADRFQTPAEVVRALLPFLTTDVVEVVRTPATQSKPAEEETLLEAIPVPTSVRKPVPRLTRPTPAASPPPRKSRTLLGCFLLAALTIVSVTGLGVYGVWLVVNRVSSGVSNAWDEAKQQMKTWEQLDKEFSPPPANASDDRLFPQKLGELERRTADTQAAIPDLSIEQKGRHAVFGQGDKAVHVYAYQPVTQLEKEALFQRAIDVAEKDKKSQPNGYSMVTGTPRNSKVTIHVDRPGSFGKTNRVRAVLWWGRDWLFIVRTPLTTEPDPLMTQYLQWLNHGPHLK
jgi:serine/threonine protein kinase